MIKRVIRRRVEFSCPLGFVGVGGESCDALGVGAKRHAQHGEHCPLVVPYVCRTARYLRSSAGTCKRIKVKMESNSNLDDGNRAECVDVIEEAFITACMPGDKPYVEALNIFIGAVLKAYQAGFDLSAVLFELQNRTSAGTLKMRLKQDEIEFRTVWITIVYKTLRHMKVPRDTSRGEEFPGMPDSFDVFIGSVYKAVKNGYDLQRIQLEQSMANPSGVSRNDFESAVLRQSTRIVYYTIQQAQKLV